MIFPQHDLLRRVAPHVAPALIPPDELAALAGFCDGLPATFTVGTLELRLAAASSRIDLEVCAANADGARPALARVLADAPGAPWARGLGRLLGDWAAGAGGLADAPYVHLEYDAPARGGGPPIVFVTIEDDIRQGPPPTRPTEQMLARARAALPMIDADVLATIERCVRRFPAGGRVCSLANLAPRGRREVRLDALVPTAAATGWLADIGWPGDPGQLAALLDLIGPELSRLELQLDLGAGVGPMLGILYRPRAQTDRPAWRRVIDRLCARGLCAPDKGEAVLAWIGCDVIDLPALAWPIAIPRELDFKLTMFPHGFEAKAYLYYQATWASL